MSTFDGRIREFPNVFVDNFCASFLIPNRRQAFFLSHAHSDHMRGLDSQVFQNRFLAHKRVTFFASSETKELLKRQSEYCRIAEAIAALPIYEPRELRLGSIDVDRKHGVPPEEADVDGSVEVTFLPAQHCPGSVSIYFAGPDDIRVLYTGDFRWEEDRYRDLSFLRRFHPPSATLTNLYLDTTFCIDGSLPVFPSRLQVARRIYEEVAKWLDMDPSRRRERDQDRNATDSAASSPPLPPRLVHFNAKSRCGHEKLFAFLCDRLSTKIHVDEDRLGAYGNLNQLTSLFTVDADATRLHACDVGKSMTCCFPDAAASGASNVLTITASTQWWTRGMGKGGGVGGGGGGASSDVLMERSSPNHLRFLYSFHPSLTELRQIVSVLKPAKVTPTAAADLGNVESTTTTTMTMLREKETILRLLGVAEANNSRQSSQGSSSSQSSSSPLKGKKSEEPAVKKMKRKPKEGESYDPLFDDDDEGHEKNDHEAEGMEGRWKEEEEDECSTSPQRFTPLSEANSWIEEDEKTDGEKEETMGGRVGSVSLTETVKRISSDVPQEMRLAGERKYTEEWEMWRRAEARQKWIGEEEEEEEEEEMKQNWEEEQDDDDDENRVEQNGNGSPQSLKPISLFASSSTDSTPKKRANSPVESKASSISSTVENAALRCVSSDSISDLSLRNPILTSALKESDSIPPCAASVQNSGNPINAVVSPPTRPSPDVNPPTNLPSRTATTATIVDPPQSESNETVKRETFCDRVLSQETRRSRMNDHENQVDDDDDDDVVIVSVVMGNKGTSSCPVDDGDELILKAWRK